ncbi:MAG: hypothetical protein V2B15_04045 [Bacteroidota bacterium]
MNIAKRARLILNGKLSLLSSILIFFTSCNNELQPPDPKTFNFYIQGYDIVENNFPGSEFSEQLPFDSFPHRYSQATLAISNNSGFWKRLETDEDEIKDYKTSLLPGEYNIKGSGGVSDFFEDGYMGYYVDNQSFRITDTSTNIGIIVRPMCGLIIIVDDDQRIEECNIVNGDYTYPFIIEDNVHYMYCFPHSDTYAVVNRTDGTEKSIYLAVYGIGYIHKILSSDLD